MFLKICKATLYEKFVNSGNKNLRFLYFLLLSSDAVIELSRNLDEELRRTELVGGRKQFA